MRKHLLLPAFILLSQLSFAQNWSLQSGTSNIYYNSGSVGIGVNNPQSPLHVVGQVMADVTNTPAFVSSRPLGVVIQQINIGNDFVSALNYSAVYAFNMHFDGTNWIRRNQYGNAWANVQNYSYYDVMYAAANGNQSANTVVTPSTYLRILSSGNVLIGKTSQTNSGYILDVNGNVRANQVVVNTSGADFVFDSSYSLMPLRSLAKFVQTNHHLPGIAPAKEMSEKGMDVGEEQTILLKKVEELTLYLLEQQKQLDQLKKENKKLAALVKKRVQ